MPIKGFKHDGPLAPLWSMFTALAVFGIACAIGAIVIGLVVGASDSAGAFAAMCGVTGFGILAFYAGLSGRNGVAKKESQLERINKERKAW